MAAPVAAGAEGGSMEYTLISGHGEGGQREYVTTSYKKLVALFGEPNCKGDHCKVSTKWVLKDSDGNVVTIYDWKETELYRYGMPSVKEFRNLPEYEWHIGGVDSLPAFKLRKYIEEKTR